MLQVPRQVYDNWFKEPVAMANKPEYRASAEKATAYTCTIGGNWITLVLFAKSKNLKSIFTAEDCRGNCH